MLGTAAAKETAERISRWKDDIRTIAKSSGVSPSLIAAIISRETAGLDRFCQPPPVGKPGDAGHGCGCMQVDDRSQQEWCTEWKAGHKSVKDSISMGCHILAQKIFEMNKEFAPMPATVRIHAAVAAYNCGEGNVLKAHKAGLDLDAFTTGKNYGKDVLERARYFSSLGYDL